MTMDNKYTFEFLTGQSLAEQPTGGIIPTSQTSTIATATVQTNAGNKSFGQGFAKRAAVGSIERFVATPLNQVTGGLASPVYQIGRAVALGSSAAVIGSSIAMLSLSVIMLSVRALEDRMSKFETEAKAKNEREVLIYRQGFTSQVSTYKASLINGVYKVNRG